MTYTLSVTGVDALAAGFKNAARVVQRDAPKVVTRSAAAVELQMTGELLASPSFKGVAPAMSYEVNITKDGIEAEIGPEFGKAGGPLATIAAYGTSRIPAWWDFTKAARDEAPNLERVLADMARDAL
jgi:hypothetical protein